MIIINKEDLLNDSKIIRGLLTDRAYSLYLNTDPLFIYRRKVTDPDADTLVYEYKLAGAFSTDWLYMDALNDLMDKLRWDQIMEAWEDQTLSSDYLGDGVYACKPEMKHEKDSR